MSDFLKLIVLAVLICSFVSMAVVVAARWSAERNFHDRQEQDQRNLVDNPSLGSWIMSHRCIDGHWYIERTRTEGSLIGYYGIAPIFDDEGKPARCLEEQE